mgnify:CR=1 FL=1
MKSRFSDIREAHATFITKYLRPSEIDFLRRHFFMVCWRRNAREKIIYFETDNLRLPEAE